MKMIPENDREAIGLILNMLVAEGWTLTEVADDTFNTNERTSVSTVDEAVDLVMNVDEAYVFLNAEGRKGQYIYFVLGNEPYEVACDYTVGLDPELSDLTNSWE